jgi:hypothetical protein
VSQLMAQRQHRAMACISRSYSMLARIGLLICALAFLATGALAQTDPASLPARDAHQGLLIAANPYISANRYKEKFGKHTPYDGGILAIELFFRNDNDSPIRVNLKTMQLLVGAPGGSRQRLDPLSPEEVADRVLAKPKDPSPRIPIPRVGAPRKAHDKDWEEFAGTVRSAALATDLLPPHATTHGFVYFDIDRHYDWLRTSRFDVPDLAFMTGNQALFFFQIDLAPAIP